jgi:HlyD family secretion protein
MSHRKSKILIWVGAGAALLAYGGWTHLRGHSDVEYRTAVVDRGDIAYTISATGSPNAVVTVQVGSQVSGNIMALYADFNTRVKKGQLVARIDPQAFEARVTQASANLDVARSAVINARAVVQKTQAELASAKAGVADARAAVMKAKVGVQDAKLKLDRQQSLVQSGVSAPQDLDSARAVYDSAVAAEQAAEAEQEAAEQKVLSASADMEVARTQLSSAEAQVKQAQAALEQAKLDLAHTYITAPVDGVVVARHVDVGQTVAASLQAPTLFEIAQDLTKMQVDTNVSEADIGHVRVGQEATFTVDAYPGQVFHGTVTQIRKAAINVQNVVTYDVVIAVPNPDLKLFPGMTANVRILVDERDGVLRVPNAALRFRPAVTPAVTPAAGRRPVQAAGGSPGAGSPPLWVLDAKGNPRPVRVSLGITDGRYSEVTGGGLKEGDRVIIAALNEKSAASQTPSGPGPGRGRGMGF